MTALIAPPATIARSTGRPLRDAGLMTLRNLRHNLRNPQLLVFATVQPVMFVLMFAYVFGGAITVPGVDYIDFLIPGILIQTVVFGAMQTSVGLAEDLSKGIVERFRTLPMARSAVLAGRTVADAGRNLFVVLLMLAVGAAIGFRFHGTLTSALGVVALTVVFGFVMSWVSVNIGLATKDPEAAQSAGFIPIFPLVFASSAFVPVESMPSWLRVFAENQPVTVVVDTLRALVLGAPAGDLVVQSILWMVGLLAVFAPLAVRQYRRTTT